MTTLPVLVLDGNWRALYSVPIYAFLCVMLAIGVGALVRQSAAAISLFVLWPLLVESLVGVVRSASAATFSRSCRSRTRTVS